MASYFSASVAAAIATGTYKLYNFIDLEITVPFYLSDYEGDIDIGGNTYIASILREVQVPPRTGNISQEVQSISLSEGLASFSSVDFISALGDDYHGAKVITRTLLEDSAGTLYTGASDAVYYSEGIIKGVSRVSDVVVMEFSNAYGKLDTLKELRTTRGSLARQSTADTSFDRADSVNDNLALDWGT